MSVLRVILVLAIIALFGGGSAFGTVIGIIVLLTLLEIVIGLAAMVIRWVMLLILVAILALALATGQILIAGFAGMLLWRKVRWG